MDIKNALNCFFKNRYSWQVKLVSFCFIRILVK